MGLSYRLLRSVIWLLTRTVLRVRIVGRENIPLTGPALLICNHISYADGFLVGICVPRFTRFLVSRPHYKSRTLHWLFRTVQVLPAGGGGPREAVESVARAREELRQGHLVCVFPEGEMSRTGNLLPFRKGFEKIAEGLDIPVIPLHLDRLWETIFSFRGGRFFWKWPGRIPYPVTVSFGQPLPSTAEAPQVRQAVLELGREAVEYRRTPGDLLHLRFLNVAKRHWFSFSMADSTGKQLTYGRALVASLLLSRWIRKHRPRESMVGLLLPSSVGGALANIAVLLAGKVPVNLNFTAGPTAMATAIEQCGIRTLLTSRRFLARAKLEEIEGMVFLEEVLPQITFWQKALVSLSAFVLPSRVLRFWYAREPVRPHSLAAVIFSSGSTGIPKGVMLSHHNVLSNVEGIEQVFWVTATDRIMGVLPFFHSFGFTGTLWFPLLAGIGVAYHTNPLDAKTIGEMVSRYRATILVSAPTFTAGYLRRCTAEEFATLRYAIVGSEKLQQSLAESFKEKYHLDLLEGYGCTEMAPIISVNVPNVADGGVRQTGLKMGTVGHPIPGVVAKVVDLETGEPLPANKEGMLLVKGPNRMMGYLGQLEKTAEVLRNGWYVTGDISCIDEDGFIRITDRAVRFSKIAGEMVPHLKVEERISEMIDGLPCAVTSITAEQKGERLMAFYSNKDVAPSELWDRLCRSDLPKLWIPKRHDLFCIETIPTLATGKTDLLEIRNMARQMAKAERYQ